MQLVKRVIHMNRLFASICVIGAGAIGIIGGAVCVYILFPLDRIGATFFNLGVELPYNGAVYIVSFAVWALATVAAVLKGLKHIDAYRASNEVGALSQRRLLEGCLLPFGVSTGVTWISAILVALGMYSLNPEAQSSTWDFTMWLLSMAGWAAIFLLIVLRIQDHLRLRMREKA